MIEIVTARPWQNGRELDTPRTGIVVGNWTPDGEYLLVWFHTLGKPEAGASLQPILNSKITVIGDLSELSDDLLSMWEAIAEGVDDVIIRRDMDAFRQEIRAERARRPAAT